MTVDMLPVEAQLQAPVTLFGTDDPVAVVERASVIATALADVIRRRHLFKHIGQSDHVFVEGWTLLGSMLGVFAEVEWSRPLDGTYEGWEARAVARTLAGRTVGAAESMCSRGEGKWRTSDDYAIRSMAQTRAVSKALRLPLGFIMELAGYSATPAEELTHEQPGPGERQSDASETRPAATTPDPAPFANRGQVQAAIAAAAQRHGLSFQAVESKAKALGIDRGKADMKELLRVLAAIEQPVVPAGGEPEVGAPPLTDPLPFDPGLPPPPDDDDDLPDLAAPGITEDEFEQIEAAIVPAKPGTPAFRALPSAPDGSGRMTKAEARAYWAVTA